ncbi:MAG: hypothetical protein EVA65_00875 [Oceanococcus sp.]|nr:MAG: hypothetical protein EVA65_00875 [Oceanococcus sp.]
MARRNQDFESVRSEGGLLPSDLLHRILDPQDKLSGTKPSDYGLPASERINEVTTQAWNRLRKHWTEFRTAAAALPDTEAATGLTNEKWSLPLLRELGFGLLPTTPGPEVDGRTYAISRFAGPVPIHLVGCGLSLDRRAAGQRGAAAGNPHGLVQEFLNRSDDHLWAIVSNGLSFRILRDNLALSRQSYLEFDLEAMFDGEAYADFVLLWMTAHASRFTPRDGNAPESCWLEEWSREAEESGTRALKDLRGSVEKALQVLGEGFTSHPRNAALRENLRDGTLSLVDFHGQLLRVVYRLIFLFVAEDRSLEGLPLLHPRDDSDAAREARERYANHYSTARLRRLAGTIKGGRHCDLWQQMQVIVTALSGHEEAARTREALALPALGSFLWDPASTAELNTAALTNFDLLECLRHLAFLADGKALRSVDYRNLGAEELGGVYESLLALTPQISADGARFNFAEFSGNERKTSGSYYTPDTLVQCLLDSALDPVVEAAIEGKNPAEAENSILALKVCDPAVGSGHFLVGVAHRLARHLARVRALAEGESEPSPLLYQHALRDVIGRCLYGVDMNPMAAELCRVGLWLEALEPGKPLSFLDHHIRVGNSLLGTTPELIAGGLPDDAFKALEGDDKDVCSKLKRRNKQERDGGQMDLGLAAVAETAGEYDTLTSRSQRIDQAPDDSLAAIERKSDQFRRLVVSPEYRQAQRISDAWCAAFMWHKVDQGPEPITTDLMRRLEAGADELSDEQSQEVERLAQQYQFFHWHLAFPEVFQFGGFDCVLGNPPWERTAFEQVPFFKNRAPEIAGAETTAQRQELIANLPISNPDLWQEYFLALRKAISSEAFFSGSNIYPFSSSGRTNTFALFTELGLGLVKDNGFLGVLIPSALATDTPYAKFWDEIVSNRNLVSMYDFENRGVHFPDVHRSYKFSIFCIRPIPTEYHESRFGFFLDSVSDTRDDGKIFRLSKSDIALMNPLTKLLPVCRSASDFILLAAIHRRVPRLEQAYKPWVGLTSASTSSDWAFNVSNEGPEGDRSLLYEAKCIHQFNHRFATYEGVSEKGRRDGNPCNFDKNDDPSATVITRYHVPRELCIEHLGRKQDYLSAACGYRDVARSTDERTVIAAILPFSGFMQPLNGISARTPEELLMLVACLNSYALDFAGRQKTPGTHVNVTICRQLPVLASDGAQDRASKFLMMPTAWVNSRALELSYTAWDLEAYAVECKWGGPPFRWDLDRRFMILSELNAAMFHLYLPADELGDWKIARTESGCATDESTEQLLELRRHFATPRKAVEYIMDTFPIVRRKDEQRYGGVFRSKQVVLEIYDKMQLAISNGQGYETEINPPPGPPVDASGDYLSYEDIADNPPSHILPPRDGKLNSRVAFQISDLNAHFPTTPFRIRLDNYADFREFEVEPVPTSSIRPGDNIVIASPLLARRGASVPAVVGRVGVESRINATDGTRFVLVSVHSADGIVQGRFTEAQWRDLKTIGRIEELKRSEESARG